MARIYADITRVIGCTPLVRLNPMAEESTLAGISEGAACHLACDLSNQPENQGKTIVFIKSDICLPSCAYGKTARYPGCE
jgi:hypothetical protein